MTRGRREDLVRHVDVGALRSPLDLFSHIRIQSKNYVSALGSSKAPTQISPPLIPSVLFGYHLFPWLIRSLYLSLIHSKGTVPIDLSTSLHIVWKKESIFVFFFIFLKFEFYCFFITLISGFDKVEIFHLFMRNPDSRFSNLCWFDFLHLGCFGVLVFFWDQIRELGFLIFQWLGEGHMELDGGWMSPWSFEWNPDARFQFFEDNFHLGMCEIRGFFFGNWVLGISLIESTLNPMKSKSLFSLTGCRFSLLLDFFCWLCVKLTFKQWVSLFLK